MSPRIVLYQEETMKAIRSQAEITSDQRFEFGKNWQRFLTVLDDERIMEAERSLKDMLGIERLTGKTFIDVGCGSGLFSLAAVRLGAAQVRSLDYDPLSVACAQELKCRYFPDDVKWIVERGDVLDREYIHSLGQWDIVYSWGVLHHTGAMWEALANVSRLVKAQGLLFLSIYNDQGLKSRIWRSVKSLYNRSFLAKLTISGLFISYAALRGGIEDMLRRKNPITRYREYKKHRGMSVVHDWFDWLGGYPYEAASPKAVCDFYRSDGFSLERLKTTTSLGCNEFVFKKM
jgi:2-polyprenyl-3-methyl-5-hydroxy-6-metoxy-1,4-benzoquinol methylase